MDLISNFDGGYRYLGYWSSPPRYGNQFKVFNREQIVKYLKLFNGTFNCGISISSFVDNEPHLLYLPFDFDSKSLDKPLEEAITLYNRIVEQGYRVSLQESGFKGYHVLVSTIPKYYSRFQILSTQTMYKNNLNLSTCDTQIFGDIRRLIRIPGTCHCGKFTKLNGEWKRLGEGSYCRVLDFTDGNLLDIDDVIYEDKSSRINKLSSINGNSFGDVTRHPIPCVEECLKHYKDEDGHREPPQLIRYSYVVYELKKGKSPEEIFDTLKSKFGRGQEFEWYDWDDRITSYQINHINNNQGYKPLKCETLKSMGFCLYNKCPYYENINKFRKVKDLEEDDKILLRMWN